MNKRSNSNKSNILLYFEAEKYIPVFMYFISLIFHTLPLFFSFFRLHGAGERISNAVMWVSVLTEHIEFLEEHPGKFLERSGKKGF